MRVPTGTITVFFANILPVFITPESIEMYLAL
jgi:hypothetical protein